MANFKITYIKQWISDVISELLIPVRAHFRVGVGVKCTCASAKKTPNKCRVLKNEYSEVLKLDQTFMVP